MLSGLILLEQLNDTSFNDFIDNLLTPLKKSTTRTSCHQCKKHCSANKLYFCTNKRKPKQFCHKKYCHRCMENYTSELVWLKYWVCPFCMDICTCKGCKKS